MAKQIVEIEADIPEGYRAVAYGSVRKGEHYIGRGGEVAVWNWIENSNQYWLILEKIEPRYRPAELPKDFNEIVEFSDDGLMWFSFKLVGQCGSRMCGLNDRGESEPFDHARIKVG